MGKKLSTFVGDSTYTRAPPTHRSPLRSNNVVDHHESPMLTEMDFFLTHQKNCLISFCEDSCHSENKDSPLPMGTVSGCTNWDNGGYIPSTKNHYFLNVFPAIWNLKSFF
jgi:hypothetical protein